MTTTGRELARALDPVAFAQACGLTMDPWQCEVLRSPSPRLLLCCSRQAGKSLVAAILALHTALYTPESLVLVVCPALRQSLELYRRVAALLAALSSAHALPLSPDSETKLSLELPNGSRILALPGREQTVRSFSRVRLLILDEAARIEDELYLSLRPMLAVSGGRIVAVSTPFGKRGWYWEAWRGPGDMRRGAMNEQRDADPWHRVRVSADQCPRIPAEFLAEERRTLGNYWFTQEYLCEFADAQTAAIPSAYVDAAVQSFPVWNLDPYWPTYVGRSG